MAIAHWHLAACVARINDVQVLVRIAKPRNAAELDVAVGLAIRDPDTSDINEVVVAATAVSVRIDLGAIAGHGRVAHGQRFGRHSLVERTSWYGDALLHRFGQFG